MMKTAAAVLALLAAVSRSHAASPVLAEIPFEYTNGLIWVEGRTDRSSEPLHLLLDSGAEVSVINLGTARRLGLPLGDKVSVCGVDSSDDGYWPQFLSATVGTVALPRQSLALDLSQASAGCERPVDGLIGLDFFRDRVVQIDFEARVIRILKTADLPETLQCLHMETRSSGFVVKASVGCHAPQWFRVDTGCASALQWVTRRTGFSSSRVAEPAVGLTTLAIPQAEVPVRLGNYTFQNVPAGLHSSPIFPGESGLLGAGLLARFKTVTLDTPNGFLVLGEPATSSTHRCVKGDTLHSRPSTRR